MDEALELTAHELIKVRLHAPEDKRADALALASETGGAALSPRRVAAETMPVGVIPGHLAAVPVEHHQLPGALPQCGQGASSFGNPGSVASATGGRSAAVNGER